jgi:sarcosine oxidase subunit gamma
MAENALPMAARIAVAFAPQARRGVAVQILPAASRFSLRLPMRAAATAGEAAGFRLDLAINRCDQKGDRWSARLGPNEWLIGGPETDGGAIETELEAAFAGQVHALTDVSHRNVAIEISGPEAAVILNAGCPLDLSDEAFPAGSATRTLLGKAEIVLMRPGEAPAFRVECWRSFAVYAHGFLAEAARDCPSL